MSCAHGHAPEHLAAQVTDLLRGQDPCGLPDVFELIGNGLDLDGAVLAKAVRALPAPFDPRFPELKTLLKLARRSWEEYGAALVDEVRKLVDRGRLFPFHAEEQAELDRLFAAHGVALRLRLFGVLPSPAELESAKAAGAIEGDPVALAERSAVTLAYRAGKRWDQIAAAADAPVAPPLPGDEVQPEPQLARVVRELVEVPLTARDRRALAYIQQRGAIYMRRPMATATGAVLGEVADASGDMRRLFPSEEKKIRDAVEAQIKAGEGWRTLGAKIHDALEGSPTLINDVDRIARTELSFAHAHGAYTSLRERLAAADLPAEEQQVFKLTQPTACSDCMRIWGPHTDPKLYPLSEVEGASFAGGNFGKPRSQWGPTIGPTHPNCTEGPLQLYRPEIAAAVQSTLARLRR